MSIFTYIRDQELPTAAKLQRLWAHCIQANLIRNCGGWPAMTVEWRMAFGAGVTQQSKNVGLTVTEAAINRLKRSLDVGLWVQSQLYELGARHFGIAYFSYVEDLNAEEIGCIIEEAPKIVLDCRLETARHLNRRVKHAAKQAGVEEAA